MVSHVAGVSVGKTAEATHIHTYTFSCHGCLGVQPQLMLHQGHGRACKLLHGWPPKLLAVLLAFPTCLKAGAA